MTKVPLSHPRHLVGAVGSNSPSRKTPTGLITSVKFKQIRSSIDDVGLIEPLSVTAANKTTGQHLLLDCYPPDRTHRVGFTRGSVLRLPRMTRSHLQQPDQPPLDHPGAFLMIRRAIERGLLSMERLAKALSVDVSHIIKKNGPCWMAFAQRRPIS